MTIKIIHSNNPYVLDYIENENEMPGLTKKNAEFLDAVVHLDSNYAKDLKINPPSNEYDPEQNSEFANGMYCGSTAYWFDEMKKENCFFRRCVLGAVIAIDSTNSTHLEASILGRKTMCDRICGCCSNYQDIVDMLNLPFDSYKHQHLISLLTQKTTAKKDNRARYNISFATKFCAYAAIYLDANIKYSKYDNIVTYALPNYVKIYSNKRVSSREYKINEYKKRNFDDNQNYQYRLDVYHEYAKAINDIIDSLHSNSIDITKEELDHIIWYGLKGK